MGTAKKERVFLNDRHFDANGLAPPAIKLHELTRSLDEIAFALVVGFITVFYMDIIPPFAYLGYLHLVPVVLLALGARRLPLDAYPEPEWRAICRRFRWSAVFALTLSPFWAWWRQVNGSYYFLFNSGFFFAAVGVSLYQLAMALRLIIRRSCNRLTQRIIYFIRMSVIYLTLGPVLAFIISSATACFDCDAEFVYQYVACVELWKKILICSPALMLAAMIWTLKLKGFWDSTSTQP